MNHRPDLRLISCVGWAQCRAIAKGNMRKTIPTFALTFSLALTVVASLTGVAATATTDWQELGGGKARMLAELDPETLAVSGAVEIVLDPDWKTYWREPGGSGIPPMFDFSGSRDFLVGDIGYPVPEYVVLPDSDFIGYHDRVLFTFSGVATGLSRDGLIHLSLMAGVCKEICIPAMAEFEIPFYKLMVTDPQAAQALADAAVKLPGEPSDDFGIDAIRIEDGTLAVFARLPSADAEAELFVEAPASWRLNPVAVQEAVGSQRVFRVDLSKAAKLPEKAEIAATEFRVTLVQKGKGIEQLLKPSP